MSEQWRTPEEIASARERFEAAIPGWRQPLAYAIGYLDGGELVLTRVNIGEHSLPTVVLATVCGHTGGSVSYELDVARLDQAIALLAPAEACTVLEHPNLQAWRSLRSILGDGDRAVAIFADDLSADVADPYVAALQAELKAGRS